MFGLATVFSGPYALLARFVAVGLLLLSVFGYGWFKGNEHGTEKYDKLVDEYAQFKGGVAAVGRAQNAESAAKDAKYKADKEKIDADHAKVVGALTAAVAGLRSAADANSRRRELPSAPPDSKRPDLLCLDRAEYQRAYGETFGRLRSGVRKLADEGTANTVDLDFGKKWALKLTYEVTP